MWITVTPASASLGAFPRSALLGDAFNPAGRVFGKSRRDRPLVVQFCRVPPLVVRTVNARAQGEHDVRNFRGQRDWYIGHRLAHREGPEAGPRKVPGPADHNIVVLKSWRRMPKREPPAATEQVDLDNVNAVREILRAFTQEHLPVRARPFVCRAQ